MRMYRTPDLCQRLQTFGLLHLFGRSCCEDCEIECRVQDYKKSPAYLIIALERLERVHSRQRRWIANPLKCLPVCHDENVLHCIDVVEEFYESFFVMWLREPCRVVVKAEWSAARRVMSFKVLHDHLVHAIGIRRVRASVTHRAASAIQILPHDHGNFPDTRIALGGAWWDHAIVENFVVQCVWPAWWSVLVHRHG